MGGFTEYVAWATFGGVLALALGFGWAARVAGRALMAVCEEIEGLAEAGRKLELGKPELEAKLEAVLTRVAAGQTEHRVDLVKLRETVAELRDSQAKARDALGPLLADLELGQSSLAAAVKRVEGGQIGIQAGIAESNAVHKALNEIVKLQVSVLREINALMERKQAAGQSKEQV